MALAACADPMSEIAEVYYRGPGPKVLCAIRIDDGHSDDADIALGLDRARDTGTVVQLYAHVPGHSISFERLERTLAGARDRGLAFFTYDDLADGVPAAAGLALSFDDAAIDSWVTASDLFDAHGARVTFFVSHFDTFSADQRAALRGLAARGHAIGNHSLRHQRGPDYAERHGIDGYLADEIHAAADALRADGHTVRTFAYPFGARTSEIDRTLLGEYALVRSVSFSRDGLLVSDPCPE